MLSLRAKVWTGLGGVNQTSYLIKMQSYDDKNRVMLRYSTLRCLGILNKGRLQNKKTVKRVTSCKKGGRG